MFTATASIGFLGMPTTAGKQIQSGCKYTEGVDSLNVYSSTSLTDILATVQHFHNLRKLRIRAEDVPETCKYFLSIKFEDFSTIFAYS